MWNASSSSAFARPATAQETHLVVITGVAGAEVEARSLELGAAGFLRKPIRKENLLPRVRAILQRRERVQSSR